MGVMPSTQESLWGDDFNVSSTQSEAKKVLDKIKGKTDSQIIKSNRR